MSMKLATYAHCNTALRCEARRRAIEAAAAGRPVVSTPLQLQFTSTGGGGRGGSALWKGARNRLAVRSMLAPSGLLATAATHTAAAAAASAAAAAGGGSNAGSGSSPLPPSLRTSATDPSPFLIGLSRTASMSRRHAAAAGLTVGEVMYPNNLNARELAYYMVAPTLTYQVFGVAGCVLALSTCVCLARGSEALCTLCPMCSLLSWLCKVQKSMSCSLRLSCTCALMCCCCRCYCLCMSLCSSTSQGCGSVGGGC